MGFKPGPKPETVIKIEQTKLDIASGMTPQAAYMKNKLSAGTWYRFGQPRQKPPIRSKVRQSFE